MHVFVSVARVSQEVSSVNSVHPPCCCTYDSLALFMHVLKILLLFFFYYFLLLKHCPPKS